MSEINIKNNKLSVSINTLGAELSSIKSKKGTEFLWQGDNAFWEKKAPILFPICGALKNGKFTFSGKEYSLPGHGFAKDMEFTGEKIKETKAVFTMQSSPETILSYPFNFTFKIIYELTESTLNITYSVKNHSDGEMFFSVGAHEGFSCPEGIEEYSLEFEKPQTLYSYTVSDSLLDGGRILFLDNSDKLPLKYEYFKTDSPVFKNTEFKKVSLVHQKSGKKITYSFPGFDNFLIWSIPGANFICLEPWAGLPDSIDSRGEFSEKQGIIKLEDGADFIISHSITFEE